MSNLFTPNSNLKRAVLLASFFALINIGFSSAQNCSAELSVENDWSVSSANIEGGAYFKMVLTNTSTKTANYQIITKNLEESCAVDYMKSSAPNVALNVAMKSENKIDPLPGNSLTVRSGETKKFAVYVSVPKNTPMKTWSCIEVRAMSSDCSQPAASKILSVFVSDPSEQ